MRLNYSRCVVLGSEPAYLGTAKNYSGAIELYFGIGDWHRFLIRSLSRQLQTNKQTGFWLISTSFKYN